MLILVHHTDDYLFLQGVNFKSIHEIVHEHKYIDFEISLLILKDPDVHPLLQSACLDFVISAYMDVNVHESGIDIINNVWHCYVSTIPFFIAYKYMLLSQNYDQLNLKSADITSTDEALDSITNVEEMRELTEWISNTLQKSDVNMHTLIFYMMVLKMYTF